MQLDISQIQIIALASTESPDWKAEYRKICRWYSKEFNTPLDRVEWDLDYVHVLTHYYETVFGMMEKSESEEGQLEYEDMRTRIIGGIDSTELSRRDQEDDEWEAQMLKELADQNASTEKPKDSVRQPFESTSDKSPNIDDTVDIQVMGENSPPDF